MGCSVLNNGSWCSTYMDFQLSISIVRNIAQSKGDAEIIAQSRSGHCLSSEVKGVSHYLNWICKFSKLWCPICAGFGRTIDDVHKYARTLNGDCLSDVYRNAHSKLRWFCEKSHIWKSSYHSVEFNVLCPKTHDSLVSILLIEGTSQFIDIIGLFVAATPFNIVILNKSKLWCPICAGFGRTIDDVHKYARTLNGDCLSDVYRNAHSKLRWFCEKSHIWKSSYHSVEFNVLCPKTHDSLVSILLIEGTSQFIDIIGCLPSRIRKPDFLKIPEYPKGLELDILKALRLKQREQDQLKKDLCDENDIYLFYIWYNDENPEKTIRDELFTLELLD
ncbi:hypothetical protein Glove_9g222 [Diversispora epigaea]|uniref:Uncharacterized protein n=1 Tax=Diversispora epigaea TaxID=1348612 RepID=A0A397JZS7_9GLOM|nr:hypothetical protein Glove_9g222 [Diversispora epigaea]